MININLIIFLILILAIFKYSNYKNENFEIISGLNLMNMAIKDRLALANQTLALANQTTGWNSAPAAPAAPPSSSKVYKFVGTAAPPPSSSKVYKFVGTAAPPPSNALDPARKKELEDLILFSNANRAKMRAFSAKLRPRPTLLKPRPSKQP